MKFNKMDKGNEQVFNNTFTDAPVAAKMNFEFLLFRQIERINFSVSTAPEVFGQNVDVLEALMTPMIDEEYRDKNAKLMNWLKKLYHQAEMATSNNASKSVDLSEYEYSAAMRKYKLILNLVQRRGFYPEKWVDIDEEGNII